jgi:hypothetical protein
LSRRDAPVCAIRDLRAIEPEHRLTILRLCLYKTGPVAAYAVQAYCPKCDAEGRPYGGRFFAPVETTAAFDAAAHEWAERKDDDLATYWPRSAVPFGFMTSMNNGGIPNHGYTHWWTMFNARQLLGHAQLLRAVVGVGRDARRTCSRANRTLRENAKRVLAFGGVKIGET